MERMWSKWQSKLLRRTLRVHATPRSEGTHSAKKNVNADFNCMFVWQTYSITQNHKFIHSFRSLAMHATQSVVSWCLPIYMIIKWGVSFCALARARKSRACHNGHFRHVHTNAHVHSKKEMCRSINCTALCVCVCYGIERIIIIFTTTSTQQRCVA